MMRRNDELAWFHTPTRQAPIAIAIIIINIIKSIIRNWWPFILILIFRSNLLGPDTARLLVGAVAVFVICISIWQYYRFHFYLSQDKLHVSRGIFRKVKMDIPFDRIQAITFEQHIIHQLFDVTKLKVDTAGSTDEEFDFAALDQAKARELRNFILKNKVQSDTAVDMDNIEEGQSGATPLIHLAPMDLIRVGVSQNHLRTAGIIVLFFMTLRDRIEETVGDRFLDVFDQYTDQIVNNLVTYGVFLFISLIIVSFVGTLIYTILRYYDLYLWKTRQGYRVEAGLFNRVEQAAQFDKIQMIRWVSNPIRKVFGIVSLRLYQASSASRQNKTTISVPGCKIPELNEIRRSHYSLDHTDHTTFRLTIDRRYFWRRLLFIGFIPAVTFVIIGYFTVYWQWYIVAALWAIFMFFYQSNYHRKWTCEMSDYYLEIHYGLIERISKGLLLFKIQGVEIKQTPYQRRNSLSTVVLYTASGDVVIPYLSLEQGLRLKNYILYRVETSRKKWM